MDKKYKHLVKPLIAKMGPEGLYPDLRFWINCRDFEGFNAHFSYGFLRKAGIVCHPMKNSETLVHPYDELLVFSGTDPNDITKLGAEISIEIGENPEEYVFNEPTVVVIPKGIPHGPVTVKKLDMPIMHYLAGLGPEYKATSILKKSKSPKPKYGHLVKKFKSTVLPKHAQTQGLIDERGVMYASKFIGPGNADQAIWMYGRDLEGLEVNVMWGLCSKCGIWHRMPSGGAHVHPVNEALIFVGLDPNNLSYLGAEIEFKLGEEQEEHLINVPTVVLCPKGFVHCPQVTRWVDKPYGFIVLCLDSEHETHGFHST